MKKAENVIVICTDRKMIDYYNKILKEMSIDIDIEYVGNRFGIDMQASLDYIHSFRDKGKEIVVTRGFLAQEIREKLDFKVIEMSISAFDVLKALYKYANRDMTIAVVECKAFIDVIIPVAELLNINTVTYEVEVFRDFYTYSVKAMQDGADAICGGAMKYYDDFFSKLDVEYISIESSESSIRTSLVNALEIYKLVYDEKRKRELIETLVNVSDVGIIASDSENKVIAANQKAAEIWKMDRHKAIGKKIHQLNNNIDKTFLNEIISKRSGLFDILGSKVLIDRVPITVDDRYFGFVLKMKSTDEILQDDSRVRSILTQKGLQAKYDIEDIKGESKAIKRLKTWVERYARTDSTVLITGESGTGKELFAQAVHNASTRKDKPFLAINCSAFSPNLLESELFGYAAGAFTGAKKEGKIGVFELAHTGTIFLDEIGDMDPSVQAKILRVIQEKEIMRVGDDKIISVDVRIIAATNKRLFEEVLKGNFREDLYYRLNVLNINIPPLRERKEDIDNLVTIALDKINARLKCNITGIDSRVTEKMKQYDWHGNVRELNSFIEKMVALVHSGEIRMSSVESLFYEMDMQAKAYRELLGEKNTESENVFNMTLQDAEMVLIENALRESGHNKSRAAQKLGIDRVTLTRKIERGSAT